MTLIVKETRVRRTPSRYSSSPTTTTKSSSGTQKRAPKKKEETFKPSSRLQKRAPKKKKKEETSIKKRVKPTIVAPSSLIIKTSRVRKTPKRYSPSPTTTTFPHKRTPKQKEKPSTKAKATPKKKTTTKPTPKKITKEKKQKKKGSSTKIPSPLSPKTRKQKAAKQLSTRQRTLSPDSYYLYSKLEHNTQLPPFNNKLTQAQIEEIESLVSPWYTVEDLLWRLRTVRKKSMLDD